MKVAIMAMAGLLSGCLPQMQKQNPLTYDMLLAKDEILLEAHLPKLGLTSPLKLLADDGHRSTWISPDGISLTFEGGILVATRGLGDDLMGASANPTLDALAAPGGEVYRRQLGYLSSENRSRWLYAACQMHQVGRENGLIRYDEHCRTTRQSFTNRYWRPVTSAIPLSEQWLSEEVGSIILKPYKR